MYTPFESGAGTAPGDPILSLAKCLHYEEGYWKPDLVELTKKGISDAVYEKYEGMVFVDFVPTSENLSAWLLEIAQKKMFKMGVKVTAVEFWETPKSHCKVEV
jgi:6-pyruvoyltetrahydropterin/6-carboxytetrahydropterin synthase